MTTEPTSTSRYGSFLPEIFQEGAAPSQPALVGRLLEIIEEVFGRFEAKLDTISDHFDPLKTDQDFLPWLASWVALVLRADWEERQQREVLMRILPLYRKRGTREGLEGYLRIYAGEGVTIKDELAVLQIEESSTVGVDTIVGGFPPYFFIVNVAFTEPDPEKLREKAKAVEAVLEIEKPAFTFYKLNFRGPTLQVGVMDRSRVGMDTLI